MSDLISRKDVIDAVESRYTEVWEDSDVDYNNGIETGYRLTDAETKLAMKGI